MTTTALGASVIVSGVSLGAGLLAIVGFERFDLARVRASALTRRWVSWVAIAALVLIAVAGGRPTVTLLFASLAAVAGWELATLMRSSRASMALAALAAGVVVALSAFAPGVALTSAATGFVVVAGFDRATNERRVLAWLLTAVGPLAIGFALSVGPRMAADVEGGTALLVATLFAVALGDVGAYVAGRSLGGPRLAPRVSPNKRWSGLLGNLAGGTIAFVAFALLVDGRIGVAWLLLPLVVAPASVAGDLLESAVKRLAGVKDAGDWLPGFGGLLDRIDSSLVALPAAYATAALLGWEVLS